MKKFCIIGVLLPLLLCSTGYAEDEVYDGKWWMALGHIAKVYFLQGLEVGIKDISNNPNYADFKEEHYKKSINELDLFYKDPQNKEIRVHVAVFIVLQKLRGASIKTIIKLTEQARQNPTKILTTSN
jgi:hypothetical protein